MKLVFSILIASCSVLVWAQKETVKPKPTPIPISALVTKTNKIIAAENIGVFARIKDISRFRGVRNNLVMGIGLVMGLEGTGDSKKSPQTAKALANYLRASGQDVDPAAIDPKNVAIVMVSAELTPFATNGQLIDVRVTSMGDAKSIRNGTLLQCELKAMGDSQTIYAVAQGAISVGGYGASAGGAKEQKGFLTVGRIPGGATIERGAPTRLVYDGKIYLELDEPDMTTANRVEERIREEAPQFNAMAINGGTIQLTLPPSMSPVQAMSQLEEIKVSTDTAATIIINERTGSIVIGGNVRIAPVALATGGLTVKIEAEPIISQPAPFSNGQTVVTQQSTISVEEETAQIAVVAPNTTVADLARIFQELKLKPADIINILQLMRQQGALKARIVIQ